VKRMSVFNALIALFLSAITFSAQAEGFMGFLTHEVAHHAVHHAVHHAAYEEGGASAPMGQDDSLFDVPSAIQSNPLCTAQYFEGESPSIENPKLSAKIRLGCFDHFTVMHSGITRTPLWSAEHLTRANLIAASKLKRDNPFHAEERLPASERAELSDYSRSGFDRGHNSPNGDAPNKLSQWQTFTLANMMPQNPNNNQVLWEGVESSVRDLTKKNGDLYVITGPLFIGSSIRSLHGRVMVPTNIYKAVLNPKTGRAAAYLVRNEPGMDYQVISIAELERISGLNLFPTLSAQAKATAMDLPVPTPHRHSTN
jgi:endonuclease G